VAEERSSFIGFEPAPKPEPTPPPAEQKTPPISQRFSLGAVAVEAEKKSTDIKAGLSDEGVSGSTRAKNSSNPNQSPPACLECSKTVGAVRRLASRFCSRRCASRFEKESQRLEAIELELRRPKPPPYGDGDSCTNWLWHRRHLVEDVAKSKRRRTR